MNEDYTNLKPAEDASVHHKGKLFNKKTPHELWAYEKILPFDEENLEKATSVEDDVEVEDIDFSDSEKDYTPGNFKKLPPLNVDSNCRITSKQASVSSLSKSDSYVAEFFEAGINFSAAGGNENSSVTDSEDLLVSDEETAAVPNILNIKCVDLNSFITVTSESPLHEKNNLIKTLEGSSTDDEIIDSEVNDNALTTSSDKHGKIQKNHKVKVSTSPFEKMSPSLYLPLNEKTKPACIHNNSSDAEGETDDEVFLLNSSSSNLLKESFLRRRRHFLDMQSESSDRKIQQNIQNKRNSDIKCDASENSTDSEIFSDDENPSDVNTAKGRSVRYKSTHFKVNSDALTDEEELFLECVNTNTQQRERSLKEWTETDESGSVRQVTEITTETSIKLSGGEEEEKMGDEDVSHTTTTTTRIVTTLTAQDGEQQQQTEEGGDELRDSMEVILNQFMSEDPTFAKSEPQ